MVKDLGPPKPWIYCTDFLSSILVGHIFFQAVLFAEKWMSTDSPWFWLLVFSSMALAALLAIGGKYGQRQARMERQYQARERVATGARGDAAVATTEDGSERRPYATPEATLIPLWPLKVILGTIAVVAATLLFKSRATRMAQQPDE